MDKNLLSTNDGKTKNNNLQLNLGCGLDAPREWINIDTSVTARLSKIKWLYRLLSKVCGMEEVPWPENVKIIDVRKGLPYKDGTVRNIFSSHMFEHITAKEADFVTRECFRVLRTGGVLRIIVPDLCQIAKEYIRAVEEQPKAECSLNFLKNIDMFSINPQKGIKEIFRKTLGHSRHLYMYDRWSLRDLLERNGFRNIEEKKYGQSRILNIELIENEERRKMSVCLEGIKE